MTEEYTQVTMFNNNETTLNLPDTKNIFMFGDVIANYVIVKSTGKSIRVLDSKQRQVGYISSYEEKTVKIAKPKWYQFIKRIRGEKRWGIE